MEHVDRARIIEAARGWLGTPYLHQASRKGAGTDCLGLVRGVWREVMGDLPETPPPYTPDWSESDGQERLLAAASRHLLPTQGPALHGDVLVFRMRRRSVAKHMGFFASDRGHPTLIHAYARFGVVEGPFDASWARRVAGIFRFPEGIM